MDWKDEKCIQIRIDLAHVFVYPTVETFAKKVELQ